MSKTALYTMSERAKNIRISNNASMLCYKCKELIKINDKVDFEKLYQLRKTQ